MNKALRLELGDVLKRFDNDALTSVSGRVDQESVVTDKVSISTTSDYVVVQDDETCKPGDLFKVSTPKMKLVATEERQVRDTTRKGVHVQLIPSIELDHEILGPPHGDHRSVSCSNSIGGGGCFAHALSALRILDESFDGCCQKLNACIDIVHQQFIGQHVSTMMLPSDRALAGVDNQHWNPLVVRLALQNQYGRGGFVFKKAKLMASTWYKTPGTYIVDGFLNRSYKQKDRPGMLFQSGHDTDHSMHDWRHSIAVEVDAHGSGRFYCNGVGGWSSIDDLWINKNGQPNRRYGYMRQILKVYIISLGMSTADH